jgi:TRAP-type uncharacterized transport system substrate-binding protein
MESHFRRRYASLRWLMAALCLFAVSVALVYFFPTPPSKITIATSFKGGAYELFGQHYRDILARSGISVTLRNTEGSGENLRLLRNPTSGVQVAFVQGGFSNKKESPQIVSLGRISYQPFWIFYASEHVWPDLTSLKGKRIAVGPMGGGTRVVAEKVLGAVGIAATADELSAAFGRAAVDALKAGIVDAVFLPGPFESPLIQHLLQDPKVRLLDMPRAEALTRRFPFLVKLTLPAGMIDLERNLPPADFTIIGTTTSLIARDDLHPQIVHELATALTQVHGDAGPFNSAGEFPTQTDPEYKFSAGAREYYRNGPSFLERYLPFWMTNYAQRTLAILLATFAVILPVFNYAPRLYRWMTRERVLKLYRTVRSIESELQRELTAARISELQSELEMIDHATKDMQVPLRHSDILFSFKIHVNLLRQRLAARMMERAR